MEIWWAFLLLGAVVGFVAGLLGVGGGAIMVPVLTTLFMSLNFLPEQVVHIALATSMASIILTSISSTRTHQQHPRAIKLDVQAVEVAHQAHAIRIASVQRAIFDPEGVDCLGLTGPLAQVRREFPCLQLKWNRDI